jgi:hypothetical protein
VSGDIPSQEFAAHRYRRRKRSVSHVGNSHKVGSSDRNELDGDQLQQGSRRSRPESSKSGSQQL